MDSFFLLKQWHDSTISALVAETSTLHEGHGQPPQRRCGDDMAR